MIDTEDENLIILDHLYEIMEEKGWLLRYFRYKSITTMTTCIDIYPIKEVYDMEDDYIATVYFSRGEIQFVGVENNPNAVFPIDDPNCFEEFKAFIKTVQL